MEHADQMDGQRRAMVWAIVESARAAGDFESPWNRVPGVWRLYDSETEILGDLSRAWSTALATAICGAIENGHGDLRDDIAGAYRDVSASTEPLHELLLAHGEAPVVAASLRKEQTVLQSVGLAKASQRTTQRRSFARRPAAIALSS